MESAIRANRDERSDETSGKTFPIFFLVRRGLPEVFNAAFPRKKSRNLRNISVSQDLIRLVEARAKKESVSKFEIGDVVNVHCKILEGDKERIQIFNGVVIARNGGGASEMFTVRRIVAGEGVERKFPVHSPRIEKIVVARVGIVRRAKLYYLRKLTGKAARIREKR